MFWLKFSQKLKELRKEKISKEIEMLMLYKLESKAGLNEVQLDRFYFL